MPGMKVTVEVQNREEALWLLQGIHYMQLLEEFYDWMTGEGREESMPFAVGKLKSLALIHGVSIA